MDRLSFVSFIKSRISQGCGIPVNLTSKAIDNIIDDTLEMFRDNWTEVANESVYMIIPTKAMNTKDFKNNNRRNIKMPKCTRNVYGLSEVGGRGIFSSSKDLDYRKGNTGRYIGTRTSPEDLVYTIAIDSYQDFLDSAIIKTVAFDYNSYTKNLTIQGRNFQVDLVATCYIDIDEESLFDNYDFQRYVIGTGEIDMYKQNALVKQKLPGGYEIDWNVIKDSGEKKIDKVEKKMEENSNTPFMSQDGDFIF